MGRYIEQSESPPSLSKIADHVGLSSYYLHRLFRQHLGVTPREYASARRRHAVVRRSVAGSDGAGWSGRQRRQGRYPAAWARAALSKNRTFLRLGRRDRQSGRQNMPVVRTA
jgi:hypothetical protein